MTLTIEVPHFTLSLLQVEANREGRALEIVAAERLSEVMAADIDPTDLAAIREGLSDADAGRLISLEEYKHRFTLRRQAKR